LSLDIQPFAVSDLPVAEAMLRDYSRELEPHNFDEGDLQKWFALIQSNVAEGKWHYWLAHQQGAAVGFVIFLVSGTWFDPAAKIGNLEEFYIVPAARGQGLGRELALAAFAALAAQGATSLRLGVLASNTTGLAFWQSLGLKVQHQVLTMPLKDASAG